MSKNMKKNTKCGFVTILGAPNSGKSTLMNTLADAKVSIVTPKAQTTRNRIRGIRVVDNTQIIFVDTPGIFKLSSKIDNTLNRSILETAKNALDGTNYLVLLIDAAKKLNQDDEEVINMVAQSHLQKILVLNKVDLVEKEKLLDISAGLNERANFEKTFMISALKKNGVDAMLKYLAEKLPAGPYLYDEDELSDMPARLMAADITREKIFTFMHEEIPYSTMVESEKFEEKGKVINIHQSIITVSEGHKKIIIGNKGAMIKKIGEQSRKELCNIFGKKVNLFLHVKVRKDWMENPANYVTSGIDLKK